MKKLFRIIKFKSKPILVAKNLSKSFNKRLVLNQINFHLNRGEIFGILGPNGSGKTTLFNLILGVHSLDNGKIIINGETINSHPIHFRCSNYKISYVPQNSACLLGLSVEENLESICEIKIEDKIKRKEIVQELLARFNLDNIKHSLAHSLSGGERRRTEIARCLINNPKVLLLDEPFAGVDLLSIQDIKQLLLKLQSRGCAVLVTDHNATQLLSVVDRAYVIANGSIVANGPPRQIVSAAEAKKLYFGEDFSF